MNRFTCALAAAAVAVVGFTAAAPKAEAQINIDIGAEPACPYGYYDFAPYPCAPYGYYGPEHFHGHVDNRFDVHHGYRGSVPNRGDNPEASKRLDQMDHFRGNEMRDGR